MQPTLQPTIGIVTVTYNSATVLPDFLRSILGQTYQKFILYIIDNASADGTVATVATYTDSRIVLIANADNRGVAAGNNQGIVAAQQANCEYILLINNDTEFEPFLIEKLLAGMAEYHCPMIIPKMMYYDAPNVIWCAGGDFNKWRFYLPYHFGQNEKDQGQYDAPRSVSYSPTCCMLIKREVFDKIGLMDEAFFVYFDDVDFCFRAMQKGILLFYTPFIQLTHKVSTLTDGYNSPFTIRYHFRNRLYFLRKHFHPVVWIAWLLWFQLHLLFDLITQRSTVKNYTAKQKSLLSGLQLKTV